MNESLDEPILARFLVVFMTARKQKPRWKLEMAT